MIYKFDNITKSINSTQEHFVSFNKQWKCAIWHCYNIYWWKYHRYAKFTKWRHNILMGLNSFIFSFNIALLIEASLKNRPSFVILNCFKIKRTKRGRKLFWIGEKMTSLYSYIQNDALNHIYSSRPFRICNKNKSNKIG